MLLKILPTATATTAENKVCFVSDWRRFTKSFTTVAKGSLLYNLIKSYTKKEHTHSTLSRMLIIGNRSKSIYKGSLCFVLCSWRGTFLHSSAWFPRDELTVASDQYLAKETAIFHTPNWHMESMCHHRHHVQPNGHHQNLLYLHRQSRHRHDTYLLAGSHRTAAGFPTPWIAGAGIGARPLLPTKREGMLASIAQL